MKKVLMNWSGGKDSSLCLYRLLQSQEYEVIGLLTSVNEKYSRVSMHGVRTSLIEVQARALGIPLHKVSIPGEITMEEYDQLMLDTLYSFKEEGVTHCAFGDIFLKDLRTHREVKLKQLDLQPLFPLWKQSTQKLAREFVDEGFKAVLTSVDGSKLDSSFVGREYDDELVEELPAGIDPCGEYGAFHSFVYDGPPLRQAIAVERGEVVERTYGNPRDNSLSESSHSDRSASDKSSSFWFIDLTLPKT